MGLALTRLRSTGMIYRQLNSNLVDAEKLLKLLEEEKEIVDQPDAKDLVLTDGVVEFRNVSFSYDGKVQALQNVSFTINKGQSVALVGSSGS
jgi:ABC-type transport system involved in Fe-S cluster assembly fused permease/ATPase subunit